MTNISLQEKLKAKFVGLGFPAAAAQNAAQKEKERADEMTAHITDRIKRLNEEAWTRLTEETKLWPRDWTQADEEKLQSEWEGDFDRLSHKMTVMKLAREVQTCRTITATYGYVPEIIMSRKHHLRAVRTRNKQTLEAEFGLWSPTFAELLLKPALHPFFKFQHEGLILAMQYAVICRTGDTQKWPLKIENLLNKDGFLEMFAQKVQVADKGTDLPRLRKKTTASAAKKWGALAESDWSVLLAKIEELAWKDKQPPMCDNGPCAYLVEIRDLENLSLALNVTGGIWGHPGPWDTDMWHDIIKEAIPTARSTRDQIVHPDEDDVRELITQVVLAEKRARELAARSSPEGDNPRLGSASPESPVMTPPRRSSRLGNTGHQNVGEAKRLAPSIPQPEPKRRRADNSIAEPESVVEEEEEEEGGLDQALMQWIMDAESELGMGN